VTGPSEWLVDQLCSIPPRRRRILAARLMWVTTGLWLASHVAIELFPGQVFEHIMLAVSLWALILAFAILIATEDVKVDTESSDG